MDNFSKHLAPLPRNFHFPYQVSTIGYCQDKKDWIYRKFKSCNFSFILSGSGKYIKNGKEWEVTAPCVLTQWPGEDQNYGPNIEWEELYLIYPPQLKKTFIECKLLSENRPFWYISELTPLKSIIQEIFNLVQGEIHSSIDRLDLLCLRLAMESLISESHPSMSEEEKIIRKIKTFLSENFTEYHDFNDIAVKHGWSHSSFRRYWKKYVGLPPGQFVINAKIREACRLLVETQMQIGEIAQKLKFDDPLYFSRLFRKTMNMKATDYRKINQFQPHII